MRTLLELLSYTPAYMHCMGLLVGAPGVGECLVSRSGLAEGSIGKIAADILVIRHGLMVSRGRFSDADRGEHSYEPASGSRGEGSVTGCTITFLPGICWRVWSMQGQYLHGGSSSETHFIRIIPREKSLGELLRRRILENFLGDHIHRIAYKGGKCPA